MTRHAYYSGNEADGWTCPCGFVNAADTDQCWGCDLPRTADETNREQEVDSYRATFRGLGAS